MRATGPVVILGRWEFLMSEVPLYQKRGALYESEVPLYENERGAPV